MDLVSKTNTVDVRVQSFQKQKGNSVRVAGFPYIILFS